MKKSKKTITQISQGRGTGSTFHVIGLSYIVTLSDNTSIHSDDEDLLERYEEVREGGRKSLDQLNNILQGKEWEC